MAKCLISATLRTSLDSKCLDKLIVSSDNDIIIMNDGPTILKMMDVDHKVAKLMVQALNEWGIPPIWIKLVAKCVMEHLESMANCFEVNPKNPKNLIQMVMTALGSKVINKCHCQMAKIAVHTILLMTLIPSTDRF
ncbi:T-complex protein 1 subunit epsilon-like [Tigriopus californicus]|uniref:T-complex protein 1 subunit epsilon-like n=1 Tax=Tigriopus californicus TaxID=6832 RepID=UPI0027DA912D|nr:T-complex protein 1 subunit epsilon-like [Tigriopus californicus]